MKKNPTKLIQTVALIFTMVIGVNLTIPQLSAQEADTAEKIQLMSDALRARDAGDLLLAKEKTESLIVLVPDDTNVQALLLSINLALEESGIEIPSETEAGDTSKKKSKSKFLSADEVSPEFVEQSKIIENLFLIGRSQVAAGDYASASITFSEIEARDPNNAKVKDLQIKLSKTLSQIHGKNLYKSRASMLNAVDNNWDRPKVFELADKNKATELVVPSLKRKLESIVLPKVNFSDVELTQVIDTLSELSLEYDEAGEGVNIVVLFNSSDSNPKVNITLRNLNLDRILQFVTQQVNFTYDIGEDAITVQPSDSLGGSSSTLTEFFPISRATMIRLTGFRNVNNTSVSVDPFADPDSLPLGPSQGQETQALQRFFQNAGVNFEGVEGSSLAFDGEQLIVTQTPRNIERLRTILRNYNEVKQVEIEAKFLEVAQNDLDEFGFNWGIVDSVSPHDPAPYALNANANRGISDFSASSNNSGAATIVSPTTISPTNPTGLVIPFTAPQITQSLDFGSGTKAFFTDTFTRGDIPVEININALARKSGSDLMSAPKVTVLSGKRAEIVVAQELRYPESYGDIESTVSPGGNQSSGSAAVSITAGTPENFVVRNVGVEMSVTPNVQSDNTIALELSPRVTEFEGFVEYGGPSIAVSSDTVATVPAGFYQPIFSTREITTEVTIYDGATVVMGGLTRDEVRSVDDRVPLLGDIPGLGRLFRSEGETRQKRNLLIFVTANLVSPGGSLANQQYDNIKTNTLFQSPSITTPTGNVNRSVTVSE
mgnify:FL=1